MKVLHFYRTYYPDSFGGVEQVIRQMVTGSIRLGIQAEVLTLTRDSNNLELEFEGHAVHRVPLNIEIASTGFSWSAFARFKQLAATADVVHYHFPWPFMDLAHFACQIDKPSVVTYHSDIVRQKYLLKLYQPLQNKFLNSVDRIVATSPNYLATSPTLAKYQAKTDVITYGLDSTIYPSPDQGLLAKWQAKFPKPFFLFVGVLRYYKGLHVLLEAAAGTEIPIVILGDGPVELELKRQAQRLGLDNVHFLGALPEEDKVALMQLCYGLAFPSHLRSEAFGITLLEAAMFGKPMISCEIGTGTSYVNLDRLTGLVVPASDPQAFREAMQYLLENPLLAQEMGRQAALRYTECFTAQRMALSYQALYQKLL
ncbi:glycosyltransferase family 4 protein [Undibacterium amnicola]|uniref:Glycosyltransferase family 4 protein n=1 Tax=Undibacterium amnicola TaxID=1834038 RepID=A0ABR6XTL2_9BURK|nr:glycosyltransferase family 4 protein [Undibacterium amnicola]MBC3832237.1 glycosyltransferase family 4 protein [Undibacterium amnicola]